MIRSLKGSCAIFCSVIAWLFMFPAKPYIAMRYVSPFVCRTAFSLFIILHTQNGENCRRACVSMCEILNIPCDIMKSQKQIQVKGAKNGYQNQTV